ncbi:hypothetical protein HUW51_15020 [Adhaeribacter swui]|uniref:Uncharacterized protein n=1 Tax=Adhaeribacter swui TaxID=2086471 RepID=A0A7G7G9Y5_9BACT|nr:hypothetical protein [Adhaeribacter swui]QNF33969.1 hypothetical protein HUW51_15020 [Adhaeribacter swui]
MYRHIFFRIVLLVVFSFTLSSRVIGQNLTKQDWPSGEVVLVNGDTLTGAVSYYLSKELIQVTGRDGLIKTFSPVNVVYFRVLNEQRQEFQTFRPFQYAPNPEEPYFKTPTFFEVVTEGKYTLVKRSNFVVRNLDPIATYTSRGRFYEPCPVLPQKAGLNNYQLAQLNVFYLLTPDEQLIPLRHPKKNLENLYQDKSASMKAFIRRRNLSYKNPVALTHVVQYFNHL